MISNHDVTFVRFAVENVKVLEELNFVCCVNVEVVGYCGGTWSSVRYDRLAEFGRDRDETSYSSVWLDLNGFFVARVPLQSAS